MAIKLGKESIEREVKKYIGIAALKVLAINPTKEKLAELLGMTDASNLNDPEYLGTNEEGKKVVRLVLWCETNPLAKVNNGIETKVQVNFNLTEEYFVNKDHTKVKVIDKYGRTAWVTNEDAEAHNIPIYKNGPARISPDYKKCIKGQDKLIDFLSKWLNTPFVDKFNSTTKEWATIDNPEDAEVALDHITDLFKGNYKELQTLINLAKSYSFKAVIGIKTNDKGNQYENVYNSSFIKNSVTNYSKIKEEVESSVANGAFKDVEFSFDALHDYAEKTSFDTQNSTQQGSAEADPWNDFQK